MGHQETKLTAAGLGEDRIAALDGDWSEFTEAQRAAFGFARKLTLTPQQVTASDVEGLRRYYTDAQVLEILLVTGNFNAMNRWTGAPQDPAGGPPGLPDRDPGEVPRDDQPGRPARPRPSRLEPIPGRPLATPAAGVEGRGRGRPRRRTGPEPAPAAGRRREGPRDPPGRLALRPAARVGPPAGRTSPRGGSRGSTSIGGPRRRARSTPASRPRSPTPPPDATGPGTRWATPARGWPPWGSPTPRSTRSTGPSTPSRPPSGPRSPWPGS